MSWAKAFCIKQHELFTEASKTFHALISLYKKVTEQIWFFYGSPIVLQNSAKNH